MKIENPYHPPHEQPTKHPLPLQPEPPIEEPPPDSPEPFEPNE